MGFLIVVGVLQFVYCVIAGNYVRIHNSSCTKVEANEHEKGHKS